MFVYETQYDKVAMVQLYYAISGVLRVNKIFETNKSKITYSRF